MMPGGDQTAAISVADGHIFVLHQGKLSKFDEKTLKPEASVSLAPKNPPMPAPDRAATQEPGSRNETGPMSPGSQRDRNPGTPPGERMQRPPLMRGGGTAITVSGGSVYVVTQGRLAKYDEKNLELQTSIDLEKKEPPPDKSKPTGE